jgi:hypothetical protein
VPLQNATVSGMTDDKYRSLIFYVWATVLLVLINLTLLAMFATYLLSAGRLGLHAVCGKQGAAKR